MTYLVRLAVQVYAVAAVCPFMNIGTPPSGKAATTINAPVYATQLKSLDINALQNDLTKLMTDNQDCWPADGGHYGGLMIRLAWHCAGTFRNTDNKGGCAGGRIRFPPESDWEDNGNLQHARALLVPIKQKYGNSLSWGDLITYAGTVAIRSMKGPTNPHCFGRVDDEDGTKSNIFGTTQNWSDTPCNVQGNCQKPLGAVKVGLIYVNPEGPLKDPTNMSSGQDPDPAKSATEIREVFARMGMNDDETASLIAGGHAFGKCHGASPGVMTSGFEGPWTTTPAQWSTEFVTGTLDEEWEKVKTPSGKAVQWQTKNKQSKLAGTMRLTSDLALVKDTTYKSLMKHWACDAQKLEVAFSASWKKLVEAGDGWLPEADRRCEPASAATGQQPDPHQNTHKVCTTKTCPYMNVGTPPNKKAAAITADVFKEKIKDLDINALEIDLTQLMKNNNNCWPADGGHYGGLMIRLAWHCAGTFRKTDGKGGCGGGRIRFPPESDWEDNGNLAYARALLVPIKQKYGDALSWGDLITFAGTVAIRSMKGPTNPHCFGRVDDADGSKSEIFGVPQNFSATGCKVQGNCQKPLGAIKVGLIYVNPEGPLKDPKDMSSGQDPDPAKSALEIREVFARMGMDDGETASLIAGGHAFGKCHGATSGVMTSGFEGPWTTTPAQWSTEFVTGTLDEEWEKVKTPSGKAVQWQTKNRKSKLAGTMRLTSDLALVNDETYKALMIQWACDAQKLEVAFAASWKKLVESGDGWLPSGSRKCEPASKATGQQKDPRKNTHTICTEDISNAVMTGALFPLVLSLASMPVLFTE